MVRFIIVGHARSGSSLLALALKEHTLIKLHGKILGEIFHKNGEFWREKKQASTGEEFQLNNAGANFLHSKIFRDEASQNRRNILAIGFKLLYKQARSVTEKSAWDYLVTSPDIRCIHISRDNLLESFVSLKLALLTEKWFQRKGGTGTSVAPQIRLDYAEIQHYFHEMTLYKRWVDFYFQRHKLIKLEYEADLCLRQKETFQRVQEFLGVPFQTLNPNIEKQSKTPLSSIVTNYKKLASEFKDTQYARFF